MPVESPDTPRDISVTLLGWYDGHARTLPWRAPPGEPAPDPYRVWLSEVMLQQTTVAAVVPYFAKFTTAWPTVEALAAADTADVMSAWAGLGYYARARNLVACAKAVAERGGFPDTETALHTLPGVGTYTAAAIAAIAFGRRAVVVDGNVERVVARLFAVEAPLPAAKPELYRLTDTITPDRRCGDFAQAMMDLGATICAPRSPSCLICPLSKSCAAFARGEPAQYPRRLPKVARPVRHGVALWVEREGRVLLVRRPEKGLLGGMLALPSDVAPAEAGAARGKSGTPSTEASSELDIPRMSKDRPGDDPIPNSSAGATLGTVTHVFTHFTLHLSVHRVAFDASCPLQLDGQWWDIARLDDAGLPTLFAKAARVAMAEE